MKSVRIEMTGRRYGRLVVLQSVGTNNAGRLMWKCQCDCGNLRAISGKYIRSGRTISCGCFRLESIRKRSITHGMSKSPTYVCWQAMKNRCYNKKQKIYKQYGALGIKVCPAWRDSFVAFLTEVGERPHGMTLDRINPSGNYELGNCRWANPNTQAKNTKGRQAINILNSLVDGTMSLEQVVELWQYKSDGYESYSPAKVFEKGYTKIGE